jgi:drug/metabolite transporter (DMT)-like permease
LKLLLSYVVGVFLWEKNMVTIGFRRLSSFIKGLIFGLLAVLCFSVITTFGIKVYMRGVTPLSLLTFRALVAGLLLFVTILLNKKISFKIDKKDIGRVFAFGLLLATHLILFWQGTKILGQVSVIYACYYTYPFWTVILASIFFKEKFTKFRLLSLFLGSIGTLLAIKFLPYLSTEIIKWDGIGLVMVSAAIWAVAILVAQKLFNKYSVLTILFYGLFICLIIFSLLQNPVIMLAQLNMSVLFYMLVIAIVSTYGAYIFFSKAIKYFGATNWGITNLSSPVFNGLAAFVFLGQVVNLFQGIGILLSMIGVFILYKAKGK